MYRLFFRIVAFCAFMAFACLCLNACLEDEGSSSVAANDAPQKENDSDKDKDGSKDPSDSSMFAEVKCPEVTSKSQFLNPDIDYGEMTDERDGQVYKTVQIGNQTWMAENLNYAADRSMCPDSLESNCKIYGRWYTMSGSCPEGWHLPSVAEWNVLLRSVGKDDKVDAAMLKSRFGWADGKQGVDAFGFSAMPMSKRNCSQVFFLTSDYYDNENTGERSCIAFNYRAGAYYYNNETSVTGWFMGYFNEVTRGVPVRCLKDGSGPYEKSLLNTENLALWDKADKKDFFNPKVEYGEMTDERDGQVYKTVKIGNQTWMAENLNYIYAVDSLLKEEGVCPIYYGNDYVFPDGFKTCDLYGRLYPFGAAMDSAGVFSDDGLDCNGLVCKPNEQVRGICPEGWRLPGDSDWDTLLDAVGGADVAGKKLKSLTGWFYDGNGSDEYGFSARPSPDLSGSNNHTHVGFWSVGSHLNGRYFSFYSDAVYQGAADKLYIRCIKGYTHIDDPSRYIPGILPSEVEAGSMTDARDGQVYKTVKIGDKTWMAENLNYDYQVGDSVSIYGSVCLTDSLGNCDSSYGRYYTWPAAMDSAGIFSDGGKGCGFSELCNPKGTIRGVCPEGWHLPDTTEWNALFSELNCVEDGQNNCGPLLKSSRDWVSRGGGYDYYDFTVLPSNIADWRQDYTKEWFFESVRTARNNAQIWLSNESEKDAAMVAEFTIYKFVRFSKTQKKYGASVRCVKD